MNQVKLLTILLLLSWGCGPAQDEQPDGKTPHPNILLIFTDDQGIGDIGYNQNSYIKTPFLDSLARSGIIFDNFYTAPVCTPSRASLLTGKYSIRTGVFDTYNAGAIMDQQETTMAEILKESGYTTAVFGKWHLGDHYPFRPSEQGFDYSLIHKAGGVGQPGDADNYFKGDSSYFNTVLYENNLPIPTRGYCSDTYVDGLLKFLEHNDQPFFAYLSFNAPHTPLQLPQEYYQLYQNLNFSYDNPHFLAHELTDKQLEDAKRVYGMLTNIDHNVARVAHKLQELNQWDNTIILFLSDNGPQQSRYRMGLRGLKTTVYEGGIKVPAFMHYSQLKPKHLSTTLSHMDLLPTLLDYIGLNIPEDIDGSSFKTLLTTEDEPRVFHTRPLFYHWTRGFPEAYRNIAVRQGDYKLVGQGGVNIDLSEFELFNIKEDPYEANDISGENLLKVEELKKQFDTWFFPRLNDSDLNFNRYIIGSTSQTSTMLTRNDGRGIPAIWRMDDHFFFWDIHVARTGTYKLKVRFQEPTKEPGRLLIRMAPYQKTIDLGQGGMREVIVDNYFLQEGDYSIESGFQGESRLWTFPFTITFEPSR